MLIEVFSIKTGILILGSEMFRFSSYGFLTTLNPGSPVVSSSDLLTCGREICPSVCSKTMLVRCWYSGVYHEARERSEHFFLGFARKKKLHNGSYERA